MIVVCGEALVDLTPVRCDGAQAFMPRPGGSPYNVAIGVARLEVPVAYLGRLSQDFLGQMLRERLVADGVEPTLLREGPELTTLAMVHVAPGAEPEYSFYVENSADRLLRAEDLPAALPDDAHAVHFGSLSLVLEPGASTLETLMRREHGRRLISLDPNVRPTLIPDPDAYRQRLEGWVALADLVKVSRADLAWLYPGEPVTTVARRWLDLGPSLLVVTLGPDGCIGMTQDQSFQLPGLATEIVDTIGAGDAFMSAVLARLHSPMWIERDLLGALPASTLRDVLDYANRAAALTCARAGAEPPSRSELDAALAT
jgi:fructokinase